MVIARILAAVLVGYALVVLLAQRSVTFPGQFRPPLADAPPSEQRIVTDAQQAAVVANGEYREMPDAIVTRRITVHVVEHRRFARGGACHAGH